MTKTVDPGSDIGTQTQNNFATPAQPRADDRYLESSVVFVPSFDNRFAEFAEFADKLLS